MHLSHDRRLFLALVLGSVIACVAIDPAASQETAYPTLNGPKTEAILRSELTAAGYSGPWNLESMLAAYDRATATPERLVYTRDGVKTEGQLRTDLMRVGYPGPWDISSMVEAYARAAPPAQPAPLQVQAASPSVPMTSIGYWLRALDGRAFLIANDGQYLGRLSSNNFDSQSICNDFGSHGSRFSSTSIRNQFSSYGSDFSSLSPYNEFTTTPPWIIFEGQLVGVVTKNQFLQGGIDPDLALLVYGCTR
jgi:hypothetical protein